MKVSRKLKRLIRLSFGGLYTVGVLYWIARVWLKRPSQFGGFEPHWVERLAGPLHLALALFFLVAFGIVWNQHIGPAIRRGHHRTTGWAFVLLLATQGITGITILYGSEKLIETAEWVHPYTGMSMLPILAWHWIRKG